MMLLDIQEPGAEQEQQPRELAVGIDLGTTNSLVAFSENSKPITLAVNNSDIVPSIIAVSDKETLVGEVPENQQGYKIYRSFKRLMGKGSKDLAAMQEGKKYSIAKDSNSNIIKLEGIKKSTDAVELSSLVLKQLKKIAEISLGDEITKAVITVPAYFDDAARNATKDAAKLAGLEVLRLVNEPTAAALAYGLDKGVEGTYAVYDLGGGTFDISVLKMQKGVFQVLSTAGDTLLGGDDFDMAIANDFIAKNSLSFSSQDFANLCQSAKELKEHLFNNDEVKKTFSVNGKEYTLELNKQNFEKLIEALVNKTIKICEKAVNDAKLEKSQIKGVVMVGGSTRVELVNKKVAEFFGTKPLNDINPDKVVALGAALQAESLTVGSDNLLLDVTPLSLGLETYGGLVEKIIARNTPIPIAKSQDFTTYQDNQNAMIVHVLQGERELVDQNRSLAKFELTGIPLMKAGMAKIRINFIVDADGLLTVSATELSTGKEQKVEIKPSYGLSEEQIEEMLRASMENAKADIKERLLRESKLEAEALVKATDDSLRDDGKLLDSAEKTKIEQHLNNLKELMKTTDRDAIDYAADDLKKASSGFAEKRINKLLQDNLGGKEITKVEREILENK